MALHEVWEVMKLLLKQKLELATIRFKIAKAVVILEKITGTTLINLKIIKNKEKTTKQS